MEQNGFPKFQYARFTEDRLEQYVVRSNEFTDFVESLEELKAIIAVGIVIPDPQLPEEPIQFPTQPEEAPQVPECPIHHVMMKERTGKNGNTWFDHRWKDDGGQWNRCNGSRQQVG